MHSLVNFEVLHARHTPKKYKFTHSFFWFKFDLDKLEDFPSQLLSVNKAGLYSFWDKDHMDFGAETAKENFLKFAKESGFTGNAKKVILYTQTRFLGYIFNPVSFILITDEQNRDHAIIEIGNTFNELKPFFVHNDHFKDDGFVFDTIKHFYISPFIALDNRMTFRFKKNNDHLSIHIDDYSKTEKTLTVVFKGSEIEASTKNLLINTLKFPFITLKIIGLIHFHAFVLWIKGIKYYKKSENIDIQKGNLPWKKKKK